MRTIAGKLGKYDFGKWTMNVSACAIDEYCEEGVENVPLPHPQLGVCQTPVLGSTNLTLFLIQNPFRPEGFKTKPFRSAHTLYSFC